MNISRMLRRPSMAAFLCATIILSAALSGRAQSQISPELLKMAGAIPLTRDLLANVKAFVQKLGENPDAKAEFLKMGRAKETTPENVSATISKYPKLEAAFKAAALKPEEFIKTWGVLMMAPVLAEVGEPVTDKVVQTNMAFCKANAEEVNSLAQAIDNLEKEIISP